MNVNNIFTNANMIKVEKPYISNLKEFLMLAQTFGFRLRGNILHKKLYYTPDTIVDIMINLDSGLVTFECFSNNIKTELEMIDKLYYLHEFDQYVIWR